MPVMRLLGRNLTIFVGFVGWGISGWIEGEATQENPFKSPAPYFRRHRLHPGFRLRPPESTLHHIRPFRQTGDRVKESAASTRQESTAR